MGLCIEKMALSNNGWGLMLGWLIWLTILVSVVETFGFLFYCFKKTRPYTITDAVFQQSRPDQFYKYEAHQNMVSVSDIRVTQIT